MGFFVFAPLSFSLFFVQFDSRYRKSYSRARCLSFLHSIAAAIAPVLSSVHSNPHPYRSFSVSPPALPVNPTPPGSFHSTLAQTLPLRFLPLYPSLGFLFFYYQTDRQTDDALAAWFPKCSSECGGLAEAREVGRCQRRFVVVVE